MTGDPTTSTDFGNISETEADVLQRVISILRPDEGAQDGFAVSIEHGRRVWHHHRASLTFVLTGEPIDGSGRCIVPARLLSEAAHILLINPDARLTVTDSMVHFGIGHHRLTFAAGERELAPMPKPVFATSATVSGSDLYFALSTHCRPPYVMDPAQLDGVQHVVRMGIRAGELVTATDWSGAGCFTGQSVIPAETSGAEWTVAVELHPMIRVFDLLARFDVLDDGPLGSDWQIEMNDEDDGFLAISCGPVRFLIDRVPVGVEAAIPLIAERLGEALEIPIGVLDKTTIQFEHRAERVCCEVFEGPDHRARFTIPVHALPSGSPEVAGAVLQEINAFNESHLGAFGFVDGDTVYACVVLPLSLGTVPATPVTVEGLVRDAGTLRECVQMAEAVSVRS